GTEGGGGGGGGGGRGEGVVGARRGPSARTDGLLARASARRSHEPSVGRSRERGLSGQLDRRSEPLSQYFRSRAQSFCRSVPQTGPSNSRNGFGAAQSGRA